MLSVSYAGKSAYIAGKTSGVLRDGASGAKGLFINYVIFFRVFQTGGPFVIFRHLLAYPPYPLPVWRNLWMRLLIYFEFLLCLKLSKIIPQDDSYHTLNPSASIHLAPGNKEADDKMWKVNKLSNNYLPYKINYANC